MKMKIKVFRDAAFEVWMDEGDEDKTGIRLGCGKSRLAALEKASKFLSQASDTIDEISGGDPKPECHDIEED
jgi:hypothetical protein